MSFTGKNILVIGASSGIGLALAQQLGQQGAHVITAQRRKPEGLTGTFIEWDATTPAAEAFNQLPAQLHGLVYCPGSITLKPFQRLTNEDFLKDYQVNVLGAVSAVQASLKQLKAANGASVVLFSTVAAQVGMGFHASIAAAKGAVEGLAKSLAAELVGAQIRVNVIAPSLTDTPLAGQLLSTDDKRQASAKRHPIARVGTPNDMAGTAAFLLSDAASWMTGQTLIVDGGMSALRLL